MEQDLTDVLCTAGKQSAVLPLFSFHFPSARHFPLQFSPSSFSSHSVFLPLSLSLISSLTLFPFHLPPYPLPYLPHPFFPLSLFSSHCLSPSILLPLFLFPPPSIPSKVSIFYFSLLVYSLPSFPSPPPTVPFPFVHSSLYPLPFYSFPFFLSVCSLLLPYLSLPSLNVPFPFVPSFLYSLPFFTGPFLRFSLFPSHCLSSFTPSNCSLFLDPSPYFLRFPSS